jgi:uncharacterized protein YjbI with pentapeptide repeats
MANDEHVEMLKKGAAAWNKWRSENPDVISWVHAADLRGAHLTGADIGEADLTTGRLAEERIDV